MRKGVTRKLVLFVNGHIIDLDLEEDQKVGDLILGWHEYYGDGVERIDYIQTLYERKETKDKD